MTDRREFLKKLAKGTAYAAPVIYTMATPQDLMAFETSMMVMDMGMGMLVFPWQQPATSEPPGSTPPGSTPPGSTGPGTTVPGSSTTGTGN